MRSARPRRAGAVAVVGLTLALAACGSRLQPDQVAALNGTQAGVPGAPAAGGAVAGGGAVPGTDATAGAAGGGTSAAGGGTSGASGGGGAAAGGGTSAAGGGTSGASGGGGGAAAGGGGQNAAAGGAKAGDCTGFKNGPGITDDTITIGNSSDISGPVPGLFEASQDAVKAYVAYFNATNPKGICGRKLALKPYDTRTDAGGDQANYADGCANVFAMVGSQSAFDSGGAATSDKCGLPDIRTASVTRARVTSRTAYGAQSTVANEFENAVPDYVKQNFPDAAKKAAMLFVNAGAASENGKLQAEAMTKRGMNFVYVQGIEVSEFNYSPFVQQLKDKGVQYVQMIAATPQFVRLAQAMKQQNYKPQVLMFDPTAYTREFLSSGQGDVEGATVFTNFAPFEEANKNPELATYLKWLNQVKPGAEPTFFGVFAWSAARLFVEQSIQLGGRLNRASLLQAMSKVTNWTANGLHSKQYVGPRRTGDGWRFIQVKNGRWVPVGGTAYRYNGITRVG
ncbi:ABC transporter substrate-binding protein [Nocardioides sp. TRM66260-LWL]|uniref:ABC transporter substrate-binding protein n=1 Tax=Nocardioides sp. TRM66260-LWL TaxID=2874478 RepID=UPI001CC359ED|nr:ABC transporter substrate-binding protein [Nocardioides sp. TRM66260-LWL]MBZ5734616.1 ABC transporter substrate-binding protein [Nocardioides sp. TRM66260-LWL]